MSTAASPLDSPNLTPFHPCMPPNNEQVRLQEYGGELLEVADNGHGVAPASYQALTLKYHTSKIEEFGDLQARGVGVRMGASASPHVDERWCLGVE